MLGVAMAVACSVALAGPASAAPSGGPLAAALDPAATGLAEPSSSAVSAWGQGTSGQLGDGAEANSSVPVAVSGLSGATAVRGGGFDSMALLESGAVMAWGENGLGQLGDGTTKNSDVPVGVSGLSGARAIAAGFADNLALLSNGTVMAWGYGEKGQLGNGTTENSKVPVTVCAVGEKAPCSQHLSEVVAIAAGGNNVLALLSNGTVVAWGERHDVPVAVSGLSEVSAIAAGEFYGLALLKNGTVVAWGDDESGQLGNGTHAEDISVPVAVCAVGEKAPCSQDLSEVTAVAAGEKHALALLGNGTVVAWGFNGSGQLGNGTTTESDVPVEVSGLTGATAISGGDFYSLALLNNGTVMAWGDNTESQLGNGTKTSSDVPVAVSGLSSATAIAAGYKHGLAASVAPLITKVEPPYGAGIGGTAVTITGVGFSGASEVNFGSTGAASFKVESETSITAVSPPGKGTVDVTVTTPGGTSAPSPADQFVYDASVTKVEPDEGAMAGGTSVTITGVGFSGASEVNFGSTGAASFKVESETSITAVSPPGKGTVDVTVTTPDGTSPTSAADRFSYGPTVTEVTPGSGEESGGTSVQITGTNFTGATAVKFGSTNAASFNVESETSIKAVSPSGKGTVDVTVTGAGVTSPTSSADRFRYDGPSSCTPRESEGPEITEVQPNSGPAAGGNSVTIKGERFRKAVFCEAPLETLGIDYEVKRVLFGSRESPSFTDNAKYEGNPEGTIVAVAPPGTGTVDITVEAFTASHATPADRYTYAAAVTPGAETMPATSLTSTSATLNATVNPHGSEVSSCVFEYGPTTSYGESKPCTTSPGSGESPVAVSAPISGLTANSTYHFRIVAKNAGGESKGADETLQSCTAEGFCNNLTHFQGEASFSAPTAVAVDPSGDIFVADSAKDQVLEFSSAHKLLRQFGSEGSGEGQFKAISAIASNSAGDVYVADQGNNRIQEFGPAGEHIRNFGTSALKGGQLLAPSAIAIDSTGDVWVLNPAGASGDRIVEFSSEGAELTKFGANGSGEGQLGQAYGLAISGGNLYVAEESNSRVQELTTSGALVRAFDLKGSGNGKSNLPYAIATEASTGDLYVTEVGAERVQVFGPEGAFVTAFGSPGSGEGEFSDPKGIALTSAGKVFVADTANKRVQEWAAGSPPTFTTSIVHYESTEASFSEPDAVAVDPSGDIFVADSAKDQVLEFSSARKLLRQFGSEGSGEGQFKGISAIATNSAGDVYVADQGNNRIQEFGPAGEHIRNFGTSALKGGQLLAPSAVAIDSTGDVWVLNPAGASGDRIVEFSSEGAELTKFGANGSGEGQLGQAYGLAISGGNLYVAEEANSRVQELSMSGDFIRAFDERGTGSGKSNLPYAIATEAASGELFVTEVGNERVQVFSAEGALITTFGSPGSGGGEFSDPKGIAAGSAGRVFVADTGNRRLQEWTVGGGN